MRNLLQHLAETEASAFDTIVCAGAGSGQMLELLRKLTPAKLILVEAYPLFASELERKLSSLPDRTERIIGAALAVDSDKRVLKCFSNPQKNSLLAATGLLRFFPNLSVIEEMPVDCVTLKKLIQASALSGFVPDQKNLLVLDIAGLELPVLRAADGDDLQLFSHIIVGSSSIALYKGDADIESDGKVEPANVAEHEITATLADAGFAREASDRDCLPPHLEILYARKNDQVIQRRLHAQIQRLELRVNELHDELAKSHAQCATLSRDQQHMQDELTLKEERIAQSESQLQALTAARDEAQSALLACSGELDTVTKERNTLQIRHDEVNALGLTRAKLVSEKQIEIDRLQRALNEKDNEIAMLKPRLSELHLRQRTQHEELIKAEAQMELIKDLLLREASL